MDMDLRPALEAIVSGMPGSSWTSEMHLVGSTFVTDYWLRVQSYAIKREEEQPCEGQRIIGKLQILRHNQRVVIAGIPLELKSSSERLFIETLYADSAGHWKILWTDTLWPATLYCSHSTYHKNKMAQHTVRADPIQVGPDVRTIGWVSGQYHQFPVKQGVGCRSITYSWCFVVPLPVDSVSQATVLLLPPQSECEHVSPRRCYNHTSSRLDHAVQTQGRHQLCTRVNPRGSMNEASRYTFGKSGSKQPEPVLNTTNASCMSALSPLLEPSSRLIILLEENRTQLSGQQLIKPIFFRAKSEQDISFTSRFVTAIPMVDNAKTPTSLPTSNNINCYTYIQTNDGLPAYTIGASISPNRTSVDKAPRLSLPHPANSCLESSSREKVRTVVPTQHGAFRDHSKPSELDSYSFERLRSSQHQKVNTYLLRELDIISCKDTIPPPWMVKLQQESDKFGNQTPEKSWSTIGTPDSAVNGDRTSPPRELDEANSGRLHRSIMRSISPRSSNESSSPRRNCILMDVLTQLNILAEQVLCKPEVPSLSNDQNDYEEFNYTAISDRCKQILSHLSTLCEEEEDDDANEFASRTMDSGTNVDPDVCVTSSDTTAFPAICHPLPMNSRVSSPMRVLVAYFKLLSELADLRAAEQKVESHYQSQWSELSELSAEIVHFCSASLYEEGCATSLKIEGESNCLFNLQLLYDLRDLLIMSPLVRNRCQASYRGELEQQEANSVLTLNFALIEKNIVDHLQKLGNVVTLEFTSKMEIVTAAAGNRDKYGVILCTLTKRLANQLSSARKRRVFFTEFDPSNVGSSKPRGYGLQREDQHPNYPSIDVATVLAARFAVESCYLEQYLLDPWLPVRQWDSYLPVKWNVNILTHWQSEELENWRQNARFLKNKYAILSPLAEYLRHTAPDSLRTGTQHSNDPKNLTNLLDALHQQALERAIQLEFFQQLCGLPHGLIALTEHMKTIATQFEADPSSTINMESTLRHLQHQLCVEFAFLSSLFAHTSERPRLTSGSIWLAEWADRLQKTYEALVNDWDAYVWRKRQSALAKSFEAWIVCAENCLTNLSPLCLPNAPENLLIEDSWFPVLWLLLCDAQILCEAVWYISQLCPPQTDVAIYNIPQEFFNYLSELDRHLRFATSPCKRTPQHLPIILTRIEQNFCDSRTEAVHHYLNSALNATFIDRPSADNLTALVQSLLKSQRFWSRRLRLTQSLLHFAMDLPNGRDSLSHFHRWVDFMSIKRDWQFELVCGIGRIIRSCELVRQQRYPLRLPRDIETNWTRDTLLRHEQSFLEALRFAVEAIEAESVVFQEAVSVCDPCSTGASAAVSLNSTLEELKHLFTRMLHDPRLGQNSDLSIPTDQFTSYIGTRLKEANQLYTLTELAVRTDWEIAISESIDNTDCSMKAEKLGYTLRNNHSVRAGRVASLKGLISDWKTIDTKSIVFSPYTSGFSWTPISFNVNQILIPPTGGEYVANFLSSTNRRQTQLQTILQRLSMEIGVALPPNIKRKQYAGSFERSDCGNMRIFQNGPLKQIQEITLKETHDLLTKSARLQRHLLCNSDEVSSESVVYEQMISAAHDTWYTVLRDPERDLLVSHYLEDVWHFWAKFGSTPLEHSCDRQQLDDLCTEAIALYIILRSLLEILCDVATAASQLEFSWTFGLLQPLETLIVQLLLLQEYDTHTPRTSFFQPLYFYQNELITLMQLTGGVFSDHHLEQLLSKSSFTSILKQTCIRDNAPNQLDTEYNSDLERPFVQEQLLMLLCWMDTLYQGRKIVDELLQQPESGRWSMAKLEVNLLRMEALEKHLRQQWAGLQIESLVDDKETVFPKGILELAKQILHSRIHYHHYRVLSRTRRHCRLNKLIIQNHIELRHLMNCVRGGLDTRVSKDKKLVLKKPTAYSLTVKMLEEADLAKLSKQFALLEQRCNEATELASDTLFHFPLDLTEFGPDKYMLQPQNERAASLLTRLHTMGYLLLDRKRIRSQLNHASKQHEKFRDLVRSLTDFMIGLRTTVHQLHSALPHLIGRHLEDLAVAVDRFETTVSRDPEAHSQPSLTQYIKMAGQRLMELETCMEHASEIARFLLLLERGTALWLAYHGERTLPVWQRRAEIEKEYENSFIGGQLNCAWGRLATMGDRLGRIQAGLPVRTASGEHLGFTNIAEDELNSLQNDSICSPSRTNLPNPLESPIDSSPVDAAKVREKRRNLRDLLGEHACVYPECKLASENWVPLSCEGSKYNRINEKARQLFMELVHFYASLRKKLIEQRQLISLHHPMNSIQHENTLESMTRSNWLQDKHLVQKYYELLRRVGEFRTCELPQVKRLMQKAESLTLLWYGEYSAPSDERGRDQSTDTSKYFQSFINESLEGNGIAESQPCLFNQVRCVTRHTTELVDDVNNPAPIDYTLATTATLTSTVNILSSGLERLRADRTQNAQEVIRSSDEFAAPTGSELDNAIMGINDLKTYDLSSINKNGVVRVNEAPRRTIIDLERGDSRKRSLKRSREFDENASGGGVWSRSNMAYDFLCHSDENAKSGPGLKFENHPSQIYFSSSRFSEQNNTRSGCEIDEDLISVSKNDLAYSQPSMVNTNKSKADSIQISNRKLKKVRRRIKLSTVKQDEQSIADGTSSMINNECAICCERFISERNRESEALCVQHSENVMGENNLRKWDKQSSTQSSASQSDVEAKSPLPWCCEIEGNRNDDEMRRSIGDKSSRRDSQLTHKATSKGTKLTESTTRQKRITKKDIGKEQRENKASQLEVKEISKEGGNERKREADHGGNGIQDNKHEEEETAIENGLKLNMQKRKNHGREERKAKQAEKKVRKNKKDVELGKRMESINKEKSINMAEQGGKQTQSKKGKHYKKNRKLNTQAITEDKMAENKERYKKKNTGEDRNTANEKILQIKQQAENYSRGIDISKTKPTLENSSLPIALLSGQVAVEGAASSSVFESRRLYNGGMRQRDKEWVHPLGRSSVGLALEDHVGTERVVGEVAGGAWTDSTIPTVNPEVGVSVDDGRVSGYVADPVLSECVRSNLLVVNRPASSPTSSVARVTASGSLVGDARVAEKVDGGRFTSGLQSGELLCMSATEAVNVDAGVVAFVKESGGADHPRMDSDVPSTAAVDISVNPDEVCSSKSLGSGKSEVMLESSSFPIALLSGQVAVEGEVSSSVVGSGRLNTGGMRQRDKEWVHPLGRSSVGFALEDHVGTERVVGEVAGGAWTDSTIPTVNPEVGVSVDDGRVSGYVADPILSGYLSSNLPMSDATAFAATFSFASVPFSRSSDFLSLNSFPCVRYADNIFSPGLHLSTFSLRNLPRRFYLKRKYLDCFGIPISLGFCRGASFEGFCRNSSVFSPVLLSDFCDSSCYLGPPPKMPRSGDNLFTYVGDKYVSQKLNCGRQVPFFFLDGTVPLSGITQWTMFPDAPLLPSDTPVCSEDADDTWATISEDLGASEETFFGERTVTKASSYSIESSLDEESILPLQGDGSKHFCRCLPPSSLCPLLLFLLLLALLTFCILHPPTCSDPTFSLFRIRCKEQNIIWSFFTHPMRVLRFGRPPF